MRLTTKGRYAVTAMLDLALHGANGPIPLADIARRQCLSLSYLEQLFGRLRRQNLVHSVHGPGGGYRLGMEPMHISISDVIIAVDERVDTTQCRGTKNCQAGTPCLTHDLWEGLSRQIYDFLDDINLAEVMERQTVREVAARQDGVSGRRRSEVHIDCAGLSSSGVRG